MKKIMIGKNKIWLYLVLGMFFGICVFSNSVNAQEYIDEPKSFGSKNISYDSTVKRLKTYSYRSNSGKVATGMISNLSNGMCEITVSYEKKSHTAGGAYVEFFLDGKKLETVDVAISEDNKASAIYHIETMNNSVLTATLYCEGKTLMKNLKFQYQYKEKYEVEGKGYEEELDTIKEYMNYFGNKRNLHLVSLQTTIPIDTKTDYLQEYLDCESLDVWDETNLDENLNQSEKNDFVLLKNEDKYHLIFDVVKKYDIIYISTNYTLLVYRSEAAMQTELENSIALFNKEEKVDIDYFRYFADLGYVLPDVSFTLPTGIYEMEIDGTSLEKASTTTYTIVRYGNYNHQLDLTVGSGEVINKNLVFDGKTLVVFNNADSNPDSSGDLYLSKRNDLYEGDIVDFSYDGMNSFYGKGFYPPDNEGAYMTGKSVDIKLPVVGESDRKVGICMKSVKAQDVEIYLNNELQTTIEVGTDFQNYYIDIPKSYLENDMVKISLKVKKSFSLPEEVEIENKNNLSKTSLKIKSIEFK
ncbi:MAG: hypothetical protein ACI4F4_02815 [Lachnospiraceae bacterium]